MKLSHIFQVAPILTIVLAGVAHSQDKAAGTASLPVYPLDIAIQAKDTAYVVDRNLPGVWEWKAGATTIFFQGTTKYRTPLNAPRTVALDKDGTLLVGDSATRDVYRVKAGGVAEPITGGNIGIPMDIAVKSDGTIYVADAELRVLVRIPAGSNKVEQVAAVNPRGVFVDSQDRVWVVSQDAQQLQIVADDGKSEIIVDHRVFEFPHQVVVNAAGVAFVTDGYKKAIWKIARGSAPEILFAGEPLDNPVGLAMVDDQLVIVDPRASKVFRMDAENKPQVWFELKRP